MSQIDHLQASWAWLPGWVDDDELEAGRRVVFRREWTRDETHSGPCMIRLSADTRYKLYVNGSRIAVGPTRGSDRIWYYDTIDITRKLVLGQNVIEIDVLRCYARPDRAWTFGRTRQAGLTVVGQDGPHDLTMGPSWKAAEVTEITFPPHKLDFFLHVSASMCPSH